MHPWLQNHVLKNFEDNCCRSSTMPELFPIIKKAYWSLAAVGGVYASLILLLTSGWTQKQ